MPKNFNKCRQKLSLVLATSLVVAQTPVIRVEAQEQNTIIGQNNTSQENVLDEADDVEVEENVEFTETQESKSEEQVHRTEENKSVEETIEVSKENEINTSSNNGSKEKNNEESKSRQIGKDIIYGDIDSWETFLADFRIGSAEIDEKRYAGVRDGYYVYEFFENGVKTHELYTEIYTGIHDGEIVQFGNIENVEALYNSIYLGMVDGYYLYECSPDFNENSLHWRVYTTIKPEIHDEENIQSGRIENEYICANIGTGGRFTIGTTGGNFDNESDDYKKLIYGHPGGDSTSYTTLNIDGNIHTYNQQKTIKSDNNGHISSVKIGDLEITQEVVINSRYKDMVSIKYKVKNTGNSKHDLGLRIMMDTQLGDNDYAPFRVSGKPVINELELSGSEIPSSWQAFDYLENPTIIGQGNVTNVANKPSKIQFANYGSLSGTAWDYKVDSNYAIGDSAVAITWDEKTIQPGATLEFETQYGLGEYSGQAMDSLYATLNGLQEIDFIDDKYETESFEVSSIIKNTNTEAVNDIEVTIELDRGLKLKDPSKKTIKINEIKSYEEVSLLWDVELDENEYTKNNRELSYKVKITGKNIEESSIVRTISVKGNPYAKEIVTVNDNVNIETITDFENFKNKLIELLSKIDEHGRKLYNLPQDRIEKEVLADSSELYTIVLQQLEYDDVARALATEGRVVKEYVIKIKISKNVLAVLNGSNNNSQNNANNNTNANQNSNNNSQNNVSHNTNTNQNSNNNSHPSTGDNGILGYSILALSSLAGMGMTIFKRRKK